MEDTHTKNTFTGWKGARMAIAFAVVLALGFVGGVSVGASGGQNVFSGNALLGGPSALPDQSADLADFWRAWNTLNEKFVETHASTTLPTSEERVWGAIEGLTSSYGDPYTIFMPPEKAKIFNADIQGNFEGVGMEIGMSKNKIISVIAPLKGTPAERAGMRTGDEILAINDTSTEGMSTDAAVKIIRGPKGTEVVFKVLREGEISEITVVRDVINVPSMEAINDPSTGVFTISFYSFSGNSAQLFAKSMEEFKASGSTRLLIDLRGNPGGYLDAAVKIAGHFLAKGEVVVTEDYKGNRENVVHRSPGPGVLPQGTRVAILIDQGSASASEILAGALQDHEKATLIGTRSYGKGSVQELVKIGEASLKVTVARWLTPEERSISDGGLTPDIEVLRTPEEAKAGKDPQKERALEFLRTLE
ncbi:MAG: S41 family peptidase [Candidatus Pacebacteria bacterium]|nr:S41 family peptidase [Candidatus Paceibacterota bacterium]